MSQDRHIYKRRFEVYVGDKLVEEIVLEKRTKDLLAFEVKKVKNYLKLKYRFASGHYETYEIFYSKANVQYAANPRKLKDAQIDDIMLQRKRGYSISQLAQKYNVGHATVHRAIQFRKLNETE